ncbi:hypothetical protein QTP88_021594 [Uroleucon formosanum]
MTKNNTNPQSNVNVNNTQTSKKTTKPIAIKLTNTADGWKTTQQNKRLLSSSSNSQPDSPTSPQTHKSKLFKTTNRYEVLVRNENENNSDDPGDNDISDHDAELLVKPPPPIYIKGVLDFQGLCTKLIELIGVDNFICKSTIDRLKIQTKHPESYRATIQLLKENKAEYHTYQLKEDKPLRVVIRNLHPSTKTETIKEELLFRNFDIRQVTNVLHKNSKVPLPLFFIDLEPVEKSKEIFLLQNLLHTKVKVEEPYKPKVISQCTNCQDYGHTQNYCGYLPRCVRCGANHPSAACPNSREHPPKCALCANNHPANYKGCTIYRELQQRKYSNKNNNAPVNNSRLKQSNVQVSHPLQDSSSNNSSNTKTYAQATSNVPPQNSSDSCTSDISKVMSSFIDEFKALIHPLLALLTKPQEMQSIFLNTEQMCNENNIEIPTVKNRKVSKKRDDMQCSTSQHIYLTKSEEMKLTVVFPLLDLLLSGIDDRFKQETSDLITVIGQLINLELNCNSSCVYILKNLLNIQTQDLFVEIKLLKSIEDTPKGTSSDYVYKWLDWLAIEGRSDTFKTFYNCLTYFVVIPVTSCGCERSFSKMSIVKTKLRSTMAQERLNALLFLFIEQEYVCNVNVESVIDDFKNVPTKRRLVL